MGEEVYIGGSQQKKWSSRELKKMIKKMQSSYRKGDEIKQSAEIQHSYDESQATQELEKNLAEIDKNIT